MKKLRLTTIPPLFLGALVAATLTSGPGHADEGMWTFHNPPLAHWKARYDFEPTAEWMEHVRLASVRFNDGGSGSFVSPRGLVLTNHHVALGQLQKLSTAERDIARVGFLARTPEQELPCPDIELNVLESMLDVTARVHGAAEGASGSEANTRRKAERARIELESFEETGLRSNVVSLYEGGEYWLYRYRKFTDVRLVFAPEQQAAYFGGDPDNFTFPRHDLDMTFFRVYEDGRPLESQHYFSWSASGADEGELVFVSGNPGGTDRRQTLAQIEYQRDVYLPLALRRIDGTLEALQEFAARGPEEERRARNWIFGYQNSRKAYTGQFEGLLDPDLMALKAAEEAELRERVADDPDLQRQYAGAWDEIEAVQRELQAVAAQRMVRSLGSSLLRNASTIVQLVQEVEKPNDERLAEYRESNLDSLRHGLYSPAPVYPDLEQAMLAARLRLALAELGAEDPFLRTVLAGREPEAAAADLVAGTQLADPAARRALVEGGVDAVEASTDTMIALARALDADTRADRAWYEEKIESVLASAGTRLAQARFEIYGRSKNPDANFTLRLSYGTVQGYPEGTTLVPYKTTYYGLFDRAASFDAQPPFDLAPKVKAAEAEIDMATPLNFVCTTDIIGGNSGSPVIDRDAQLVGLIFDGNIQSLTANFIYDESIHRAVAVHSAGILEAIRKIYGAEELAAELTGR